MKAALAFQAQAPGEMPLAVRQIQRALGGRLRTSLLNGLSGWDLPLGTPRLRVQRLVEMAER